ncbi:DUF3298 and DUF4163 domain-containing protein [Qipengyuania gelatinilytica]|uniref:DUF3298 and DUF4163 domain-containing protein n=1 Tax=Qipengyuania gelatinilytica TaxID=2867231 RepID=A0ABX9A0L7_9SPHN|nr:DUF3298 and DUF4163 domain-containing protein [Qipengyuania gelatinilytica]QZD94821.1 DUF3298 and DUF4163 domain-containing protein [Qipengyuania gelatinilytica]
MRAPLFLISLALSSAGCSEQADEGAVDPPVAETPPAPPTPPEPSPDAVTLDDDEKRSGGTREFAYSWPAAVNAQPALAAQFEKERDAALASQKKEWEQSLVDFPGDCVSCKARGYEKEWQVVADLPDWLSLSADIYEYTGGAHGNYTKQSLVWDKQAGTSVAGIDLFTSPVALENALGARLCNALDRAREAKRGIKIDRASGDLFNDCPGLDEASVLIGSSNGQTFDRIGVYFGPYVAGPYAEGDYELNFPVTASVIDAVKPEYASAFRVKR